MAIRPRAVVLAIVLVTAPLMGVLAHTPTDDAASGQDAPDDVDEAMNVSPGSYVGNLTPGSSEDETHHDDYDSYEDDNITRDGDWYRTNASMDDDQLSCTEASFAPDEKPHNETEIHLHEPSLEAAEPNTTTSAGATLAHVGPSTSNTRVGLTAMDPPRVTEYEFDVDVLPISEAGGAGSYDEIPGPCFGGNLEDNEVHEWTFHAEAGEMVYVSLGTELPRADDLVLEAPNGTQLGSITSGDDIAIGAQVLEVTGNYTLSLQAGGEGLFLTTSTSDYLVGFSPIDDPGEEEEEEEPCSPHCM